MRNVTISVSIPTYNRLPLLKRTLKSVFSQTEPANEVIVVDDGSTDKTWEYLQTVKGIKAYRNEKNLGMIENWNETIKRAKSEYVVSLHSDDLLLPDYVKSVKERLASFSQKPAALLMAGYLVDENEKVIGLVKPFKQDFLLIPPETIKVFWDELHFYIAVTGWTVYQKKAVEQVGYFTRKYEIAAENEMALKLLPRFPIGYCSQLLFAMRRHGGQGYEKKTGNFGLKQEVKNWEDGFRVLYDYEEQPEVVKAFSRGEQEQRLFIRRPVACLLPQAIYRLVVLDVARAQTYWRLFLKHYPQPLLDWITVKIIWQWTAALFKQWLINWRVSSQFPQKL